MWCRITSDRWILQTVCGYAVELSSAPKQISVPKPFVFNDIEKHKISNEMERFLQCGIIDPVANIPEPNEYISNIFIRPKKDGRIRVILNLKEFNEHVEYIHFKMETLQTALDLMTKDCYFGSVDLSEAYYSIPIRKEDRRFFRFWFNGQKYQFTSLVMGLTTAPRVFTKVLKPVFATLRAMGLISTAYVDDSCLQGQTYQQCENNILTTIQLMDSLGLTIHPHKSSCVPSKQITFVGFILCSETMTVRLPPEKKLSIKQLCQEIITSKFITIRIFAKLIGSLVASEPGVQYAPLFYKPLEHIKDRNLNFKRGNYESYMKVTDDLKDHIKWWIDHIDTAYKPVTSSNPDLIISTDSSLTGWGAHIETENLSANGVWSTDEQSLHINLLELKACQMALLSFCKQRNDIHVQILTDNTTTCAYINKLGGRKTNLNDIARDIWLWCIERNIHLSSSYIPGTMNTAADRLSRTFNDDLEWSLDARVFQTIVSVFGKMDIDLFASRLNAKLNNYVSRYPEPNACAIDAFSINWDHGLLFINPPFSVISRILKKLQTDQGEAVLVAPIWETQCWWPILLQLLCQEWYCLPPPQKILSLPHKPNIRHPLSRMKLGVFRISGKPWQNKGSQNKEQTLFWRHGGVLPNVNIPHISGDG